MTIIHYVNALGKTYLTWRGRGWEMGGGVQERGNKCIPVTDYVGVWQKPTQC